MTGELKPGELKAGLKAEELKSGELKPRKETMPAGMAAGGQVIERHRLGNAPGHVYDTRGIWPDQPRVVREEEARLKLVV